MQICAQPRARLEAASRRVWLTILTVAVSIASAAGAAEPEWINITDNLTGDLEGYQHEIPGARGVGGLAVDRHSGRLLAGLNGPPWGLYRSDDGGESWTRIDAGHAVGGWVRPFSIRVDAGRPGRIAVFRSSPPAPEAQGKEETSRSGVTLDGGKTWRPILQPTQTWAPWGGWSHGMVDWSDAEARAMVAQQRWRPDLSVSRDGGKSFEPISKGLEGVQPLRPSVEWAKANDPDAYARWRKTHVLGYGIANGRVLLGDFDGIKIIADSGEEPEKVADFRVSAFTPVLMGATLYWGGEKGLLTSTDGGKSWSLQGAELPMIRQGPLFGADAAEMVVVTDDGVYRTTDAGKNWKKITDLYRDPTAWRPEMGPAWLRHDYAWDHSRNTLYVSGLAGSIWKLEVPE